MSDPLLKDRLRELRESMNFTQIYVGQYLNMTRQGYGHYESGKRTPNIEILKKLSKLYNIEINELINPNATSLDSTLNDNESFSLNKKEQKAHVTMSPKTKLAPDEWSLISSYRQLKNYEQKEHVQFYIKKMVQESNLRKGE